MIIDFLALVIVKRTQDYLIIRRLISPPLGYRGYDNT
jgi:hypothetical protein